MARAARLTLASLAGATLAVYAGLQVLGRVAGTTGADRRQRLPGDELVDPATIVTEHATDIAGEPQEVWPWLTQLGWHLGGYYTPKWVDRLLFPGNWPSLDRLDPALVRDLRAGDLIPDGPPGTAFYRVATAEPPHVLVLHSTTHVPPGWDRHGAAIDWTWCFALSRSAPQRTRVRLRVRANARRIGDPQLAGQEVDGLGRYPLQRIGLEPPDVPHGGQLNAEPCLQLCS
jgi:hypothetical protein